MNAAIRFFTAGPYLPAFRTDFSETQAKEGAGYFEE
jgi:hypothetical protein